MGDLPVFDNRWFIEMIERFSPDTGDAARDGHSRCLLVAACIMAQSIDAVEEQIKNCAEALDAVMLEVRSIQQEGIAEHSRPFVPTTGKPAIQ